MDRNFESNMGANREQGVADLDDDYGMGAGGAQAHDKLSTTISAGERGNTEDMGTGYGAQPSDARDNEYGMGNERSDAAAGTSYEEGMGHTSGGPGVAAGERADDGANEYGMGSGRSADEEGMGIIPGHGSSKKDNESGSGGGIKDKLKGMLHRDK